jgi:ABC-type uncharacterized transport system auxiliary subunit
MSHNNQQARASNCIKGGVAMGTKAAVTALALAALTLCGCGAVPQSKYYELQVPSAANSAAASDAFPVTILVGPLKASHFYREDRLVYATESEEMGTYQTKRWAAPPTDMIRDMIWRTLQRSHRYAGVYLLASSSHGDFILEGNLYDFKEVSSSNVLARVNLALELREIKTGSIVWTHECSHDEPVNGKEVSAVVTALDQNAQHCVTGAEASLAEYFTTHNRK